MDITKDNAVDKKKFLVGEKYLVSGLSIKPVRNNDITKWDNFDKIKTLSVALSLCLSHSNNFELSIYPLKVKKNSFFKRINF